MFMDKDKTINQAVKNAQKKARQQGLKVGGVVAHPSDPLAYSLLKVRGNIATVNIPASKSPTKKEVRKRFPLNELFNPNVASREADRLFFS